MRQDRRARSSTRRPRSTSTSATSRRCMQELCDARLRRARAGASGRSPRSPTRSSACGRSGCAYVDFAHRHPNHYRLMFMTPHPPHAARGQPRSSGATRTRTPTPSSRRRSARRSRAGGSAPSSTTPTSWRRSSGRRSHGCRLAPHRQVQRPLGRLARTPQRDRRASPDATSMHPAACARGRRA